MSANSVGKQTLISVILKIIFTEILTHFIAVTLLMLWLIFVLGYNGNILVSIICFYQLFIEI